MEKNYDFRKRLEIIHKPNLCSSNILPQRDEVLIEEGWSIVIHQQATRLVFNVAKDLQDFFLVSMNVSVVLKRVADLRAAAQEQNVIILATEEELPEYCPRSSTLKCYRFVCASGRVIICGKDERGVGQGSYFLEDLMSLRQAPVLKCQDIVRQPVFAPRMVHSGWGIDKFPDSQLNAIAHAGMDAILVFTKGVDETPSGYKDFNHLVYRAANYGIDVYFYSYLVSEKHPDEPDAEEYYDSTYGALFKACPGAKGVILVGESCEFPSKDSNTTQRLRKDTPSDGLSSTKPSPGWWPCVDYPQWLNMIKKVIHKHAPAADIVFWTYNWGWAPEEARLELIRNLPEDITLLVTFEMFEQFKQDGVTSYCADYTIAFAGPGEYFKSEAQEAKKHKIRLYTMSNTAGMTWDFGVVPYIPVPFQWIKRHQALNKAHEAWELSGLMESHHYGWWPSIISELAKWAFWEPSPPQNKVLRDIAEREFGSKGAPIALDTWFHWSEAITKLVFTQEDQYGPLRVGPSYPLLFLQGAFDSKTNLPAAKHAMIGNRIVLTNYHPHEHVLQSPGASRLAVEINSLHEFMNLWNKGIKSLERAIAELPKAKREDGERMLGLGKFILNTVRTTVNVKEWWKLKHQLLGEADPLVASKTLEEMVSIARLEIENAKATISLVEADSRLGWEPSMEYMTDREHLLWKIKQVTRVVEEEIPKFRQTLALTGGE